MKTPQYWLFGKWEGLVDSFYKGPVMRRASSYGNVIMSPRPLRCAWQGLRTDGLLVQRIGDVQMFWFFFTRLSNKINDHSTHQQVVLRCSVAKINKRHRPAQCENKLLCIQALLQKGCCAQTTLVQKHVGTECHWSVPYNYSAIPINGGSDWCWFSAIS